MKTTLEDLNLDVLLHVANKMQGLYQFEAEQAIPKSKKRRDLKGQILVWESIETHLKELQTLREEPVIIAQKQFERES